MEIDAPDEEGKTPLYHASLHGMARAIPILIKQGANITKRDALLKKTPVDVAKSEKIRQIITEYTSLKVSDTNKRDMSGFGEGFLSPQSTIHALERQLVQITEPPKINPFEEGASPVTKYFRCKFFSFMKTLQNEGVKALHHTKKPFIYTGSWLEGVQNLEQLYDLVKSVPPPEVMVRTFNILCPYDKPLPQSQGAQEAQLVQAFFGQEWYDGNTYS